MRRGRIAGFDVICQQIRLIKSDGLRVLSDVAGVVNAAGQAIEIAVFNGGQLPDTQPRGRSDGFEADALPLPPASDAENACLRHNILWDRTNPGTGTLSRFDTFPRIVQDFLSRYNHLFIYLSSQTFGSTLIPARSR
jgi:hypothetical protein